MVVELEKLTVRCLLERSFEKYGSLPSDAFAETGKGFGNYIMVIGLAETVALFIMVFMLGIIG
jgi:hypothetical protein